MAMFQPVKVGKLQLAHRVVFAPTMRKRVDPETGTLKTFGVDYYAQRASYGGLVISECTLIHSEAGSMKGSPGWCPGIFTPQQISSWKAVTDAVHGKGGFMFLQLWFMGRVADKRHVKKVYSAGSLPVGPNPDGRDTPAAEDLTPLTQEDMDRFLGYYRQACRNADVAGFDGVELHGANGYLIDQFVQTTANNRTDEYGGPVENRIKFPLAIISACCGVLGEDRVGIKISPFGKYNNMRAPDTSPLDVFVPYVKAIVSAHPNLAFIEAMNPTVAGDDDTPEDELEDGDDMTPIANIVRSAKIAFISNGGYDAKTGAEYAEKTGDLVSYSRFFVSNPDLSSRLRNGYPLAPYDKDTLYAYTEAGYTTYPPYES